MLKIFFFLLTFFILNIQLQAYQIKLDDECGGRILTIPNDLKFDKKTIKLYYHYIIYHGENYDNNFSAYYKIKNKIPELDPVIIFHIQITEAVDWLYDKIIDQFEKKKDINVLKQTYKNFSRSSYVDFIISRIENTKDLNKQIEIVNNDYRSAWINIFHDQLSKIKPKENYIYWKEFLKKYKIKEKYISPSMCD